VGLLDGREMRLVAGERCGSGGSIPPTRTGLSNCFALDRRSEWLATQAGSARAASSIWIVAEVVAEVEGAARGRRSCIEGRLRVTIFNFCDVLRLLGLLLP